MDKPREIENKVGRIRPLGREIYDRRAATAIPGATGGRPSTSAPLAAATGEEVATISATPPVPDAIPKPLGDISGLVKDGKLRYARRPPGVLPTINRLNRRLEDYTINNEDLVNVTASYFERLAEKDPQVLQGFDSPYEAAQWSIAHIARSFEPGEAPRMVDIVHQSRVGRRVHQFLRRIEEAQNGES